jgi:hypothetical protein
MEFTEEVYRNKETKELCRKVEALHINYNDNLEKAFVIVGIDGIKIAITADKFDRDYVLHDMGEKIGV